MRVATLVNMLPNVAKKTMRLIALCRKADEHENVMRTNKQPMSEMTEHPRSMETMTSASSSVMPFIVCLLGRRRRRRRERAQWWPQAGRSSWPDETGMCGFGWADVVEAAGGDDGARSGAAGTRGIEVALAK